MTDRRRPIDRLKRIVVGIETATATVAGRVFYPRLRMAFIGLSRAVNGLRAARGDGR